MLGATFPLIVFAAIAKSNAAPTNAFVPSATSRFTAFRQPWSRDFVPTAKRASAAKDTVTAIAVSSGGGGAGTTSTGFWERLESVIFAPLEIKTENGDGSDDEDPRLVLVEWENIWEESEEIEICDESNEPANRNLTATATAAVESLTNFLEVWARITLQNDKGLTTPVSPTKFSTNHKVAAWKKVDSDVTENSNVTSHGPNSTSMKLIFRPPKRYLSYKEQKSMEKTGAIPDRKGAKVDAWSPGGVEIQVTTRIISKAAAGARTNPTMQRRSIIGVTARRCDFDGDTVAKKTTERAIVRRLENAIRVWKKSNNAKK